MKIFYEGKMHRVNLRSGGWCRVTTCPYRASVVVTYKNDSPYLCGYCAIHGKDHSKCCKVVAHI